MLDFDTLTHPLTISGAIIAASTVTILQKRRIKALLLKFGKNKLTGDFGVPDELQVDWLDLDERRENYENEADALYAQFGKQHENDEEPDLWMQNLPEDKSRKLKFLIMAQVVVTLHLYKHIEETVNQMQKLYQASVISKAYWESCLEANTFCANMVDYLKTEMRKIDPKIEPREMFQEGWTIISQHGVEWPTNQGQQCPPGCMCETSTKKRIALAKKKVEMAQIQNPQEAAVLMDCIKQADEQGHSISVADARGYIRAAVARREEGEAQEGESSEGKECPPGCDCEVSKAREQQAQQCPPGCDCKPSRARRANRFRKAMIEATGKGYTEELAEPICRIITQLFDQGIDISLEDAAAKHAEILEETKMGPFFNLRKDGFTWSQSADKVELIIEAPTETPKDVIELDFTVNTMKLSVHGDEILNCSLHHNIVPEESHWDFSNDIDLEEGDEVILSGLVNDEFNGVKGVLDEKNEELLSKGRYSVKAKDGRMLAIKGENIIVTSPKGKIMVVMKKEESLCWPNPAWTSNATEETD